MPEYNDCPWCWCTIEADEDYCSAECEESHKKHWDTLRAEAEARKNNPV
jgi:predicted nucleic acid-binding Zn ribbon protein